MTEFFQLFFSPPIDFAFMGNFVEAGQRRTKEKGSVLLCPILFWRMMQGYTLLSSRQGYRRDAAAALLPHCPTSKQPINRIVLKWQGI
jgi:hypothetical protein